MPRFGRGNPFSSVRSSRPACAGRLFAYPAVAHEVHEVLVLVDVQKNFVHFADEIFYKDKRLGYTPIDETKATIISCAQSRDFLCDIGIGGEVIHTPSHSEDSVSVILDNGNCIVGDLEPMEYLAAYSNNRKLKCDWKKVMEYHPKQILYAHANEKHFREITPSL